MKWNTEGQSGPEVIDGEAIQPLEYVGEEPVAEEPEPRQKFEGNSKGHGPERLYSQPGMPQGWIQARL